MNRHYTPLWLLLAVAFALFFLLSCFDSPRILGHELKTSGMADALLAEVTAEEMSDSTVAETDTAAHPEFPVPVDTAAKTILFIGDSMLEGLSPRLAAYANASGHRLYTVIWYSSTSQIWGESHKLSHYIDSLHPDYLFICLGANELFVRDIKEKRRRFVKEIVSEAGNIPFLWIGPPNWRDDTGINELIAGNTPRGCYFRSDGMKFDRKKDGAHPTASSAIEWMDSIVRWMPDHSAHPIRLVTPERKTGRPVRVFIHQPVK